MLKKIVLFSKKLKTMLNNNIKQKHDVYEE